MKLTQALLLGSLFVAATASATPPANPKPTQAPKRSTAARPRTTRTTAVVPARRLPVASPSPIAPSHERRFGESWGAPITARPGEIVRLSFPQEKLREWISRAFRGTPQYVGQDVWSASVGFSIDGGPARYVSVAGQIPTGTGGYRGFEIKDVNYQVPPLAPGRHQIHYWVEASGRGRKEYFSNLGANYLIEVVAP